MCHSKQSRPPLPSRPRQGVRDSAGWLISEDGTRLMAHRAWPDSANTLSRGTGIVLLPDGRGLHQFHRGLTAHLGALGYRVIAVDYYARELGDGLREEGMDVFGPIIAGQSFPKVAADIRAAVDELAACCKTIVSLGFCYGGSHSWMQSAFDERIAGSIGFYGKPEDARPYLSQLRGPLLMLMGGADVAVPRGDAVQFDHELDRAGVEHQLVIYDGAPHSFFDSDLGCDDAVADAWEKVLSFLDARESAWAG